MATPNNALEYLMSKTQVDLDCLDVRVNIASNKVSTELGPFVDCTSNQADAYCELINPRHADLLKKTAALANEIKGHYHSVNFEELAMELSVKPQPRCLGHGHTTTFRADLLGQMLSLAMSISPNITGACLVMVNPRYSYSTTKIIDNGQRLYRLCKFLDPDFDLSRLIIKVPSTWEGMQACRKLKSLNVKTLATTLFSMEQAVLAAEAGVVYISPFLNDLRATFDSSIQDPDPIFDIVVQAQRYYEQHSYPTRVKACCAVNAEQILQVAGVHAYTAPADQLRELASMQEPMAKLVKRSRFKEELTDEHMNGDVDGHTNGDTNAHINGDNNGKMEKLSFIDDESSFRLAFSRADEGRAQMKTTQALNLFSDYQIKAEALMRDNDMTKIG
ncbi:MAG: hypothetical protein LQ339_006726 [Xanthoria mediterranea]|nr:MAG: hypothetical protein LQ339_006726 [Xanthoria mediterranea]